MIEARRNIQSIIFGISLMIFLLAYIHSEKEGKFTASPDYSISLFFSTSSDIHAIIAPAVSPPEIHFCCITTLPGKCSILNCPNDREFLLGKQVSRHIGSYWLKYLSAKSSPGLALQQKIPIREKGANSPPIS